MSSARQWPAALDTSELGRRLIAVNRDPSSGAPELGWAAHCAGTLKLWGASLLAGSTDPGHGQQPSSEEEAASLTGYKLPDIGIYRRILC